MEDGCVIDHPRRLTPAEVSEHFDGKVSTRTLSNWRCMGGNGPPYIRLGNKIFYPEDLLIEWEAKQIFTSTQQYSGGGDGAPA